MPITFANAPKHFTDFPHVAHGIVHGFVTDTPCREYEILYFIHSNGNTYMSDALPKPVREFNTRNRGWTRIDVIPDHAEYIGRYRQPRVAR